ncbi:hypothetical protein SAMN04488498_11475 [Mesorhizobium albiziae]|uniref:Uncharacterized protein n=1 Tax=Neomesorhizobium albiziae TaxID=335020 RepID=A0A1I4CTI8_9HYPH|nr:hypothetical protein [Mesorhizobium albiziae]GLS31000.1 hypothetical protein GCM10007937_27090 [Mesorhizobium albiziae]SFK84083.1 hypothetical protein SAMN04488498_11475 [Mesorhizobium albiziae]
MSSGEKAHFGIDADSVEQLNAWVDRVTTLRSTIRSASFDMAERPGWFAETRASHLRRLAELCRRAGIDQADILADTLMLLTEGVRSGDNQTEVARRKLNRICKATIAAFSRR